MTLKDSDLVRATGKIDTINAYNTTLEAEIKESRAKIAELNNQIHSRETSTIQHEHKKNQQEIEIFDLK